MCSSVIALAVVFVTACEVQCSAVRLARDHSGCGSLSMLNCRLMRIRSLTFLFGALAVVRLNLRQTGTRRVVYLKFCT